MAKKLVGLKNLLFDILRFALPAASRMMFGCRTFTSQLAIVVYCKFACNLQLIVLFAVQQMLAVLNMSRSLRSNMESSFLTIFFSVWSA